MKGFGRDVRELAQAGCTFVRHGKGDHDIWRTPQGKPITVPLNIMSGHTANGILKDAGLPKEF